MAGLYPDAPGPRLAYDRDGTIAVIVNDDGTVTQLSATQQGILAVYNNESSDYGSNQAGFGTYGLEIFGTQWLCLIFPSPRTLIGWRFGWIGRTLGAAAAQWSVNTTNGFDGTWTNLTTAGLSSEASAQTKVALRSGMTAAAASGIKALRFRGDGPVYGATIGAMHLYGYPTDPGHRLRLWHPTLDQPLSDTPAHLDFAEQARGAESIRSVRVKNQSGSLRADNITVSVQALTDANPSLVGQHTFRYNGGAWGATTVIPSLLPGEISQAVDIRLTLAANAQLSLWSQRYLAVAGAWL